MKIIRLSFFLLLVTACQPSNSQSNQALSITLGQDEARIQEETARSELYDLHKKYDLDKWIFTRKIIVKAGVISHSHPVLTINTKHIGNETATLATYLHEQFHWYLEENSSSLEKAIADLRIAYPNIPKKRPRAARSDYSTYLHLIVCALEFDALSVLVGEGPARAELESKSYYTWVYEQVLENDQGIRAAMKKHKIELPGK